MGGPFPPKFGGPKHEIWARFRTTSRLDREYLWNTARNRKSENGVANYGQSHAGKLNLAYFGPQTVKNKTGVLTHPPAIVHRTGVNKSVAFARWQHAHPTRGRQAGSAMHLLIWNVVFANKSRKLGWIWMKLGRWG